MQQLKLIRVRVVTETHQGVCVELQHGSCDVGRQRHIVTHSSLLETSQEEQSENTLLFMSLSILAT